MLIVRRTTLRPNDASGDEETMQLAARLVSETEHGGLRPNRDEGRARGLSGAPAMKRVYGTPRDPDRLSGSSASLVDHLVDAYETFHQKQPIQLVELPHDPPTSVVCIGDALAVAYRTDKWKEDGDDEDYKHVHEKRGGGLYTTGKGVKFYEPAKEYQRGLATMKKNVSVVKELRPMKLPGAYPKGFSRLGYCLGAWVRRYDTEPAEFDTTATRGCDLLWSPSTKKLAIYSPKRQPDGSIGFLAIMAGGSLRVVADGIDG